MDYKKKITDSPRKNDALSLKECIEELLKQYRLKSKFNQVNLVASWENIMGKTIASRTNKIFFKDKTLYVEITSAPLKHQLSMAKSKIIQLVNSRFQEELIEEVVFL
jgi:hypothetical protein